MKTQTRLVAPNGGWGIFVCIGMALPFISGLAALPSFGLIFGDFLHTIGAETSAVAFITSAFFCAFSFAGLFSGSLFNRYGLRAVGLMGGCLYFSGSLLQIFVRTTWELLFAFSVIQGTGFGLIVPTSYTTFNNYFVEKRVMWMSFAQSLIGVGTMFYPVGMQKLMELYGFRGCLLVLAAINSHAILGMLLMQPVEWHMRKVTIQIEPTLTSSTYIGDAKKLENEDITLILSTTINNNQYMKYNGRDTSAMESNNLSRLMHGKSSPVTISRENVKNISNISSRTSSITNLGNWTGPIVVRDASPEMTPFHSMLAVNAVEKESSCWQSLVDFLDLKLLKKPIYLNIVLGISFALYSDIAFFTLQPLYLFELGFTKSDTASIIAIGAAADLASRIFLAFSAIFIQMRSRYIYLAGSFFTIIARFAFLNVFSYVDMACTTAAMGFLRTWIHVPLPLVFAEYLPKERFATGYGLFMFLQGNIMFAVGPLVGYLRDLTQDYIVTFYCLNFFMALCAVPWLMEIVCVKFRRKGNFNCEK
ncbi:monocarboxylate transporter 9 [Bactrocera dorsalis]|uniref:Monocarboxylate transporter 9 n=1 Tax=Bactrocera dorsalis TaxID=27457 RepID=A0A6I9VJW1_BACDO|nr:monocarboxylate transporter 9 [Bactrocera dorsalis]